MEDVEALESDLLNLQLHVFGNPGSRTLDGYLCAFAVRSTIGKAKAAAKSGV